MEPLFIGVVLAILWLSTSLLAEDIRRFHATELRLALCPAHA